MYGVLSNGFICFIDPDYVVAFIWLLQSGRDGTVIPITEF